MGFLLSVLFWFSLALLCPTAKSLFLMILRLCVIGTFLNVIAA